MNHTYDSCHECPFFSRTNEEMELAPDEPKPLTFLYCCIEEKTYDAKLKTYIMLLRTSLTSKGLKKRCKLDCQEYEKFLEELCTIHDEVDRGDFHRFKELKL